MSYTPNQNKRNTYFLSLVLLLIGITAFLAAPVSQILFIAQLCGIACITASIFVLNRYALTSFSYSVDEDYQLTVYKLTGNKSTAVARMPLSCCHALIQASSESKTREHLTGGKYSYRVNLITCNLYYLYFKDEAQCCRLTLELSKDFASSLSDMLPPDARITL